VVLRLRPVTILKKVLTVVAVFYLILSVNFLVFRAIPSHQPQYMTDGGEYHASGYWPVIADLRLNDSMAVQYLDYLYDATRGDFSVTFATGTEISDLLPPYVLCTVFLLVLVVLLSVLLGAPIARYIDKARGRRPTKTLSALAVVVAALPAFGFALMLLLLNDTTPTPSTLTLDADILIQRLSWDSWTSATDMIMSSGVPLLAALVPTLGMYVVLCKHGWSGSSGIPGSSPPRDSPRSVRRYLAAVYGSATPMPLFFISWAMCCVVAADIACSFNGLGTLIREAFSRNESVVVAAAALASSMITFAAILVVQLLVWFATRHASVNVDGHDPAAFGTMITSRGPASRRIGWRDVTAFARSVIGRYRRSKVGLVALAVLVVMCAAAVLAPTISTVENPWQATDEDAVLLPPSIEPSDTTGVVYLLGTDFLGRDMYSLVLYGVGAPILALFVVFAVSVTTYLFIGWLGRTSTRLPTRGRTLLAPLPRIVSMTSLSVPVVVLMISLRYNRYDLFGVILLAAALALSMSLWGWELMTVLSMRREAPDGQAQVKMPGNRLILADAMRASKLSVLVALPALMSLHLWYSSDAGLFSLVTRAAGATNWSVGMEAGTSCWWIVVPPVACMMLLTISAYTVIDVLEGLVRGRPEGAASEQGVLAAPDA